MITLLLKRADQSCSHDCTWYTLSIACTRYIQRVAYAVKCVDTYTRTCRHAYVCTYIEALTLQQLFSKAQAFSSDTPLSSQCWKSFHASLLGAQVVSHVNFTAILALTLIPTPTLTPSLAVFCR